MRTRCDFLRAVGLGLALVLTAAGCARERSATLVRLEVASDGEFLAFTPTELSCPSGAKVRVIFKHNGQRIPQKHNWALLMPGSEPAIEKAATAAGEASGWIPAGDSRILAATPLCAPGAEAAVEFIAPAPGDYPFICTTPGHAAEMRGTLHVTAHSFFP